MSLEENKALVRRFQEQLINHRAEAAAALIDEVLPPDYVDHVGPQRVRTRDEFREGVAAMKRAFSDERATITQLVAEGDRVVVEFTVDATHTGEFLGHPATGKPIRFSAADIYRIADGRIAEAWHHSNALALLRQTGVIPEDYLRERGVPLPPAAPPAGR